MAGDGHGTGRVVDRCLAHGSQQHADEAAPAARPDDEEVRAGGRPGEHRAGPARSTSRRTGTSGYSARQPRSPQFDVSGELVRFDVVAAPGLSCQAAVATARPGCHLLDSAAASEERRHAVAWIVTRPQRPLWLFSSGPIADPSKPGDDPVDVRDTVGVAATVPETVISVTLTG